MKKNRLWIVRIVLTVITAAMVGYIFYHSSMNADDSSAESGSILDVINSFLRSIGIGIELNQHFIRKLAHFTEYFVLGVLLCLTAYAYVRSRGRMLLIALPAGLAAAICDELIQLGSAGRSCEVRDMLLDYCAVLTAALIMMLILYLISRRKEKKLRIKEGINRE